MSKSEEVIERLMKDGIQDVGRLVSAALGSWSWARTYREVAVVLCGRNDLNQDQIVAMAKAVADVQQARQDEISEKTRAQMLEFSKKLDGAKDVMN